MILIVSSFAFAACGNNNKNTVTIPKFTITYETNGGSDISSMYSDVVETEPETTKTGYDFQGWFTDSTFSGEKITFPYAPIENTRLYAKWQKNKIGEKNDLIALCKSKGTKNGNNYDWVFSSETSALTQLKDKTWFYFGYTAFESTYILRYNELTGLFTLNGMNLSIYMKDGKFAYRTITNVTFSYGEFEKGRLHDLVFEYWSRSATYLSFGYAGTNEYEATGIKIESTFSREISTNWTRTSVSYNGLYTLEEQINEMDNTLSDSFRYLNNELKKLGYLTIT